MKHLFLFAALLFTTNINANDLADDPPIVKPEAEQIILVPQDMHDIDRSIAYCGYTYDGNSNTLSITCHGTGSPTMLKLSDMNGNIVNHMVIQPDIEAQATFMIPGKGTYSLILESFRYYGEGIIIAY